jgi:hypothetical protein
MDLAINADFDGDGFSDAMIATPVFERPSFLRGSRDGVRFEALIPAGPDTGMASSCDFDGNGIMDVVFTNMERETLTLLRGQGSGFEIEAPFPGPVGQLIWICSAMPTASSNSNTLLVGTGDLRSFLVEVHVQLGEGNGDAGRLQVIPDGKIEV